MLETAEHGAKCVSQNLLQDFKIMCKFGTALPH